MPAILDIHSVLVVVFDVLILLGGIVKQEGCETDTHFGRSGGVGKDAKRESMRSLVTVVVASLSQESLISRGWNTLVGFDPHCHHPALTKVEVVCILPSYGLLLSGELHAVWSNEWRE